MSYETHLFLRGRVFYLRLVRPVELQRLRRERGLPAKRDTWCSLTTADPWEARKRAVEAKGQWLKQVEAEWHGLTTGEPIAHPCEPARAASHSLLPRVQTVPPAQREQRIAQRSEPSREMPAASGDAPALLARPARGQRLSDHFDRYLEEQHGAAALRSCADKRATVRRFVESAGDLPVGAYTAEHIAAFKRALRSYP